MRVSNSNDGQEWAATEDTISGLACLKHRITRELGAFGKKGQVWQYNTRYLKVLKYNEGYENVTLEPIENINKIFARLQIPKTSCFQLDYSLKSYYNNQ